MHRFLYGLAVGGSFFYKALWSILFGVAVTAAVDVFVDKDRMARALGRRDPATTAKAAALGAASSSCTFGAVSIAQSLFKKGASAEATFAFALASTNIVFELAVLIYVLLGKAFFIAELISGVFLIVIMYVLVRATLPLKVFETARRRLQARDGEAVALTPDNPACGHGGILPYTLMHKGTLYRFCSERCRKAFEYEVVEPKHRRLSLKKLSTWYQVADRYFRTIGRIYKSVVIGFLVAGFIVAFVPASVWTTLFLNPSNFAGALENVTLGVLVGMFSFIGSIGIVPFAAALYLGGASFGAAVGCIVADLITVPVLNVWRTFFGNKATAYIWGVFFASMVGSSLAIDYLFKGLGWIPSHPGSAEVPLATLRLNWTLVLTLLFLALTAGLVFAKRLAVVRGAEIVRDPVCRMTFEKREASALRHGGKPHYFCSEACAEEFDRRLRLQNQQAGGGPE